jgi:hypothetical protein
MSLNSDGFSPVNNGNENREKFKALQRERAEAIPRVKDSLTAAGIPFAPSLEGDIATFVGGGFVEEPEAYNLISYLWEQALELNEIMKLRRTGDKAGKVLCQVKPLSITRLYRSDNKDGRLWRGEIAAALSRESDNWRGVLGFSFMQTDTGFGKIDFH